MNLPWNCSLHRPGNRAHLPFNRKLPGYYRKPGRDGNDNINRSSPEKPGATGGLSYILTVHILTVHRRLLQPALSNCPQKG